MPDPIVEISALLTTAGISHCLVGGYAVAVHGIPRQTVDIDFLIALPATKTDDFTNLLRIKGYKATHRKTDLLDPLGDVFFVQTEVPVQLICAKYQHHLAAIERAVLIDYSGQKIRVVTAEDLVIFKLKAGGPRDLWDAENLLAFNQNLDLEYLLSVAKELRVDRRLKSLIKRIR